MAEQLVKSTLRPVTSSLGQKGISASLKRAILEVRLDFISGTFRVYPITAQSIRSEI